MDGESGVSCHSHTTGLACLVLSQAGDCVRRASGPSARVCLSSSRDREELPGLPEIPSEGASASLGRMQFETQKMVLYLNIADELSVENDSTIALAPFHVCTAGDQEDQVMSRTNLQYVVSGREGALPR